MTKPIDEIRGDIAAARRDINTMLAAKHYPELEIASRLLKQAVEALTYHMKGYPPDFTEITTKEQMELFLNELNTGTDS
jgi:hypothetical protein